MKTIRKGSMERVWQTENVTFTSLVFGVNGAKGKECVKNYTGGIIRGEKKNVTFYRDE